MLRSAEERKELAYAVLRDAVRHGPRPPRLPAKRRLLMKKTLLGVALLAFAAISALTLGPPLFGENFRSVIPDRVYRSGQLSPEELDARIRRHELRSIVNLRGEKENRDWYRRRGRRSRSGTESRSRASISFPRGSRRDPHLVALIDHLEGTPGAHPHSLQRRSRSCRVRERPRAHGARRGVVRRGPLGAQPLVRPSSLWTGVRDWTRLRSVRRLPAGGGRTTPIGRRSSAGRARSTCRTFTAPRSRPPAFRRKRRRVSEWTFGSARETKASAPGCSRRTRRGESSSA